MRFEFTLYVYPSHITLPALSGSAEELWSLRVPLHLIGSGKHPAIHHLFLSLSDWVSLGFIFQAFPWTAEQDHWRLKYILPLCCCINATGTRETSELSRLFLRLRPTQIKTSLCSLVGRAHTYMNASRRHLLTPPLQPSCHCRNLSLWTLSSERGFFPPKVIHFICECAVRKRGGEGGRFPC